MFVCHKCGAEWVSEQKRPHFKAYCEGCSAYLHCCKNCKYHDLSAPNQCYIPNTETVADRSKMNYCDEFEFREGGGPSAGGDKASAARAQLDTLLGGDGGASSTPQAADEARDAFDGLFGGD